MQPYRIVGVEASPYSVKLRAILRYRRLPHVWDCRLPWGLTEFKDLRPKLMPVAVYPDGSAHVDSTPIALDWEERHPGDRSILPDDPGLAFLACLIEDMADEWITKLLFFYRFDREEDQRYAAFWVMDDNDRALAAGAPFEAAVDAFLGRQLSRVGLVGATEKNAPALQATYRRLLDVLKVSLRADGFLFGSRPSLADFALYGQLKTLATDPTPMALMRERAPHLEHWVRRADDLSGVEGAWRDGVSASARLLLEMAGDAYLPFLMANAAALTEGRDMLEVEVAGGRYRQPPFAYQAKCLAALRARYDALPEGARTAIAPVLDATGCAAAFAE